MNLVNLDDETRKHMLNELNMDVENDALYLSKRLTSTGRDNYEQLFREAISNQNADWLAQQLNQERRMKSSEITRRRGGNIFRKQTPRNDHVTLAYGEFNRFYIRGLCARAIEEGIDHVVVYRAKQVGNQRPKSAKLIDSRKEPQELLDDLRSNIGKATKLGIPGGPNSRISVKLPNLG